MVPKSSETVGEAGFTEDRPTSDGLNLASNRLRTWYREQQRKKNIENGSSYLNEPPKIPAPERHSPSRLLKCHRRLYYQLHNAPAETDEPTGIFWFGSKFETEVAVPYLQSLTEEDQYIRNSMWVGFTIEDTQNAIRIRGETDPVFVDEDSEPLVVTEVKTTTSLTNLNKPRPQHLAQIHCYLYGLSEEHDREVNDAVILYADRDDFSTKVFQVDFDTEFWKEEVLTWAEENSNYRRTQSLPPPTPEFEWECGYCPYQKRCGRDSGLFSDQGVTGLLPLTDDYPKKRLKEYLEAYPDARLTPTLAHQYPELASEWGSYDWECPVCSSSYPVEEVSWEGSTDNPPYCKSCAERGTMATLQGPAPESQAVTPRCE